MSSQDTQPKPGSAAAIKAGCTCPASDNAHGEGIPVGGQMMHWCASDCPLHGAAELERQGQYPLRTL